MDNTCEFTNECRLLIPVLWLVKNTEYPTIDSLDWSFIHFGHNSVAFRRYTTCVNDTWWKTYADTDLQLTDKSIPFTLLKALQIRPMIPNAWKLILYPSTDLPLAVNTHYVFTGATEVSEHPLSPIIDTVLYYMNSISLPGYWHFFHSPGQSLGGLSDTASDTISCIGCLLGQRLGICPAESTHHLFQKIALSFWRGNATAWINRSPSLAPSLDGVIWLGPLGFCFCVFVLLLFFLSFLFFYFFRPAKYVFVCIALLSCKIKKYPEMQRHTSHNDLISISVPLKYLCVTCIYQVLVHVHVYTPHMYM